MDIAERLAAKVAAGLAVGLAVDITLPWGEVEPLVRHLTTTGYHPLMNDATRGRVVSVSFSFFKHYSHFPAQTIVGGFTLGDLLDKPWSQVSSLLPPATCLCFLLRIGFSIPTARRS